MADESSTDKTEIILNQLQTLVAAAQEGHADVLPHIQKLLDNHPQLWQHFGDLSKQIQSKWVGLLAGNDAAVHESLLRTTNQLRDQLLEEGDSALERLLIDRIVVSRLMTNFFDSAVALAVNAPEARMRYLNQQSSKAQKRHLAAVKSLAETRKLMAQT